MKTDNELIAEFMGPQACYYRQGNRKVYEYDTSWDWLMPVVEKISQYVYGEQMEDEPNGDRRIIKYTAYPRTFGMLTPDNKWMVRFNRCQLFIADSLIKATYEGVVDFIKWYNDQKNATLEVHPKEA